MVSVFGVAADSAPIFPECAATPLLGRSLGCTDSSGCLKPARSRSRSLAILVNYEEWEDFVWAPDKDAAWAKCQEKPKGRGSYL